MPGLNIPGIRVLNNIGLYLAHICISPGCFNLHYPENRDQVPAGTCTLLPRSCFWWYQIPMVQMATVNNKKPSTYKCVEEICFTGNINSDERSGISNPSNGKLENILKIAISSITNNFDTPNLHLLGI